MLNTKAHSHLQYTRCAVERSIQKHTRTCNTRVVLCAWTRVATIKSRAAQQAPFAEELPSKRVVCVCVYVCACVCMLTFGQCVCSFCNQCVQQAVVAEHITASRHESTTRILMTLLRVYQGLSPEPRVCTSHTCCMQMI